MIKKYENNTVACFCDFCNKHAYYEDTNKKDLINNARSINNFLFIIPRKPPTSEEYLKEDDKFLSFCCMSCFLSFKHHFSNYIYYFLSFAKDDISLSQTWEGLK